ncbi:MAG: hypothetical protein ABL959_15705 [Pyrinomonadaceae bacterium]
MPSVTMTAKYERHAYDPPAGFSLCRKCGCDFKDAEHYRCPVGWQPIETAPKNASWIRVILPGGQKLEAHWAQDLSGEEQPPFKGWFRKYEGSSGFSQIAEPIGWRPLDAK